MLNYAATCFIFKHLQSPRETQNPSKATSWGSTPLPAPDSPLINRSFSIIYGGFGPLRRPSVSGNNAFAVQIRCSAHPPFLNDLEVFGMFSRLGRLCLFWLCLRSITGFAADNRSA